MDTDRLPRRRCGRGRRDRLCDPRSRQTPTRVPPRGAPHSPHRPHPSAAVARLALPRGHYQPRGAKRRRTSSTAITPRSNSRSVTSKTAPVSPTAHRASSSPTPRGSPARCSLTTSSVGPPDSATCIPTPSSPSCGPCERSCSRCPAGVCSTAADDPRCASRPDGPGPTPASLCAQLRVLPMLS